MQYTTLCCFSLSRSPGCEWWPVKQVQDCQTLPLSPSSTKQQRVKELEVIFNSACSFLGDYTLILLPHTISLTLSPLPQTAATSSCLGSF